MTPAEAGAVILEEPDWRAFFEEQCARWPRLQRWLAEDGAYEETLRQWRRFHATPHGKKKMPAPAVDGIIALAHLRIFPPRFLVREIPRDGATGYQHDDHMWLSIAGEQWRIAAVEDRILHLERMDGETKQIDLNRAQWRSYTEAAVAVMKAQMST